MKIWMKQLATVALSAMILSGIYGCAALPRAGGPGAADQQQGAAGGAAEAGGGEGAGQAQGGRMLGGIGNILGGGIGYDRTDMGQQISQVVGQALDGGSAGGGGLLGMGAGGANADGAGQAGRVGVSTLVVGNMAMVGVDLNTVGAETAGGPGVAAEGGMPPRPAGAPAGGAAGTGGGVAGGIARGPVDVEGTVKNQVRTTFPQVADVFVTTDPDLVHQISVIAGDIQQGVSISGRIEEVFSIARRMTPAGGAGM